MADWKEKLPPVTHEFKVNVTNFKGNTASAKHDEACRHDRGDDRALERRMASGGVRSCEQCTEEREEGLGLAFIGQRGRKKGKPALRLSPAITAVLEGAPLMASINQRVKEAA